MFLSLKIVNNPLGLLNCSAKPCFMNKLRVRWKIEIVSIEPNRELKKGFFEIFAQNHCFKDCNWLLCKGRILKKIAS